MANVMLTVVEAELLVSQHLGDTARAAHARFVAYVMRRLAEEFVADADLWEIVGLCHDLDFFAISGNWSRHGLLTVEWLSDRLPPDAQNAIASHDHRTGVQAGTLLADMLKVADVIAVIDARLGRRLLCDTGGCEPYAALRHALGDRTYLCDMLEQYTGKHALSFARIAAIMSGAPSQSL